MADDRSRQRRFEIRGLQALQRKLQSLEKMTIDTAKAALYQEAEMVMFKAKKYYVPVDIGVLKTSGTVKPPTRTGKVLEVELRFGGASAPYALEQHERLDYQHTTGEAKYLEKPLMRNAKGMAARISRRIGVSL